MNVLVVDGYNIIGAWDYLMELKEDNLEDARDLLIEQLAEYQAYKGDRVIIVFDAHYVRGIQKKIKNYNVEVIFTKENETADECIERLVKRIINVKTTVYVATSDYTEQRTIFAQGALRKSARELFLEVKSIQREIEEDIETHRNEKSPSKIPLSKEVLDVFEKWRRGKQ
ncbi:NYN domain-containing protein [Radiobacillus kanasensis]|uniref:NYN domain-containing protein n=1 Tax=Radiobacillus kanasensis TaxID=2844358 RepID=UPI001E6375E6|nr:NYN domain-containing protein [Radiobacillus kanasensis]UFT99478.1 NYN domain-containing protein [Radiobacillus kanasensis]